jgi:hypothetical protein
MLRIYSEKDSVIAESANFFKCFSKINKCLSETKDLKDIEVIKEDFEWFESNKDKIINSIKSKFHEAIRQMVNLK